MVDFVSSFQVIDSHTAGHPTRVIQNGIPPLVGDSVLKKRQDFINRLDHLRSKLLHEPRGHAAMVGLVPVPSTVADYGCFFISSYVYLDMCGHATIGLAKTLAFTGELQAGRDAFTLETPAGVVRVGLEWEDGSLTGVLLRNVPSYLAYRDLEAEISGLGKVWFDLAYSGPWYALVDAAAVGLSLTTENVGKALQMGASIKEAVNLIVADLPEVSSKPSVLFYDKTTAGGTHLVVLESNKFDRSPCGTGTCARVAQLAERGDLRGGDVYRAGNLLGNTFEARIEGVGKMLDRRSFTVEIRGKAFITAVSTLMEEAADPIRSGFLCR